MRNLIFSAAVIALIAAASCKSSKESTSNKSKFVPLSYTLIKDYNLTPQILKRLQYYSASEEVLMEKNDSLKNASVGEKGKLLLNNLDAVKIKPYTPGRCIKVIKKDSFYIIGIAFGANNYNLLYFGPGKGNDDDVYGLYSNGDVIQYGKELLDLMSGSACEIFVDPKEIQKIRTESGRKVY